MACPYISERYTTHVSANCKSMLLFLTVKTSAKLDSSAALNAWFSHLGLYDNGAHQSS